jgi:hypothetical protein
MHSDSHTQYCYEEFERRFINDDDLKVLLTQHDGFYLPDGETAAPMLCNLIEDRIRKKSPLSILRVGNGEGNAWSMHLPNPAPPRVRAFYTEFNSQNGLPIPMPEAIRFCAEVKEAIVTADVIGYRLFRSDERASIMGAIAKGDEYAALGATYAREVLKDGLTAGWLRTRCITSAWLHLDVLPYIDRILACAEAVIVITGRVELQQNFSARLGNRLKEFISVPVQGFRPASLAESHFYNAFPEVKKKLERHLGGTLVLVGAGLFGKVYTHTAKTNGAVAIDLGSAFDILAGLRTRPMHNWFPCEKYRWIIPTP